jgi:hypothetical protein
MVAGVGVVGLAVWTRGVWTGLLAAFVAFRSWAGFQQARLLARLARAPRHPEAVCPSCRAHPLRGDVWGCDQCGKRFDTFAHRAVCPGCGKQFPVTECPDCQRGHPIAEWFSAVPPLATAELPEPGPREGQPARGRLWPREYQAPSAQVRLPPAVTRASALTPSSWRAHRRTFLSSLPIAGQR